MHSTYHVSKHDANAGSNAKVSEHSWNHASKEKPEKKNECYQEQKGKDPPRL
jgi:hypothetical protein